MDGIECIHKSGPRLDGRNRVGLSSRWTKLGAYLVGAVAEEALAALGGEAQRHHPLRDIRQVQICRRDVSSAFLGR